MVFISLVKNFSVSVDDTNFSKNVFGPTPYSLRLKTFCKVPIEFHMYNIHIPRYLLFIPN